jgi:hypothetical protein
VTVYVVTSKEWTLGCMGDAYCNDRVAALVRAGAVHIDAEQIGSKPLPSDHIITFVNPPGWDFLKAVPPQNRWLFAVDEVIGGSGIYEKQVRRCKEHSMGGVVVTYGNESHMQVLRDAGLKVVYFPLVMPPVRPKKLKTGSILMSGQVDPRTYPERARLCRLFPEARQLPHPGYWPNLRHDIVGEKYLDLLDTCELIVTDKAGYRDRFVAKYYESAACHALPIGNLPSYMPQEITEMLVNTEGMPDADVKAEVIALLSDVPYLRRCQDAYEAMMRKHYDPDQHAQRVLWEVDR